MCIHKKIIICRTFIFRLQTENVRRNRRLQNNKSQKLIKLEITRKTFEIKSSNNAIIEDYATFATIVFVTCGNCDSSKIRYAHTSKGKRCIILYLSTDNRYIELNENDLEGLMRDCHLCPCNFFIRNI